MGVKGEAGRWADCLLSEVMGMASATIFVSYVCAIYCLIRTELMVRVGDQAASVNDV